jgi:hypothetical protein
LQHLGILAADVCSYTKKVDTKTRTKKHLNVILIKTQKNKKGRKKHVKKHTKIQRRV